MHDSKHSSINYCNDTELFYEQYQTEFSDGYRLKFDEAYRLAHLPLVAPDHRLVIPSKSGSSYFRGIHDVTYSIAIPISIDELLMSDKFMQFMDEIRASKFALKLSWDTFDRRKDKLHATICGTISHGHSPNIQPCIYSELRSIGPIAINIGGLFSGNINIGRLYLKVYPERRNGKNMCHEIQNIFGAPLTNLYVVGLFNLFEELDVGETQELKEILKRWGNSVFLQLRLEKIWLLKSKDDLVLDGAIEQIIPLV